MRALGGFLVRLVAYAVVLLGALGIAEQQWERLGLWSYPVLQPFHDAGLLVLVVAPIVLAVAGFAALRVPAVFVAAFLVGAALTAPFAVARFAGIG